jgi:hypothetical protein
MTPSSTLASFVIPQYLAEAFEDRGRMEDLCAEEVLIRLVSTWVNDPESKADYGDLPKALYAGEQRLADLSQKDGAAQLYPRQGQSKLRRCRNCGIRVPKPLRIMPWKACSEDCADELWIQANKTSTEF